MSEQNPSKKNSNGIENSVKSIIDHVKSRFGLVQSTRPAGRKLSQEKRLELLLSDLKNENWDEHPLAGKPYTSIPSNHYTQATSEEERDVMNEELRIINLAIERKYAEMRALPLDAREESLCIDSIQKLEMRRLNLMTRLHGQNLKGYAAAQ